MNLVTLKAAAKHELLFDKRVSEPSRLFSIPWLSVQKTSCDDLNVALTTKVQPKNCDG
jgi:hypothetical protein